MDTNTMSAAESSATSTSHITGADLDDFGLVDYESPYLEPHDDVPAEEVAEEIVDAVVATDNNNDQHESETKPDMSLFPEAPLSASASIYEGVSDLIDYEDSDAENADEDDGGADDGAVADDNDSRDDGDIDDDSAVKAEAESEEQRQEPLIVAHETEDIDGVYDYTDVHSVRSSSSRSSSGRNDIDLELDLGLDQELDEPQQEQPDLSLDSGDAVIDLTAEWSVPDVWVYSEGEWLTYLGPGQSSYDQEMQLTLFMMPLDQLIEFLQSEIMLGSDTVVSLEFPSLALVIDQRDRESSDINLSQIYNWHLAAVRAGKVSVDVVNSPYFSALTSNQFIPSPDSFSFIIHTRPAVHSTIQRIMQLVEENQQPQQHVVADDVVELNDNEEVVDGSGESAVPVPNGKGKEHAGDVVDLDDEDEEGDEAGSTADLLADHDDDEGEDEDDDFAPEDEDANDHKLDADALEGDDLEDEVQEEDEEDGTLAEASSNKRGSEHMSSDDDGAADGDDNVAEPAAKKARSVTEEDAGETESAGAEAVAA